MVKCDLCGRLCDTAEDGQITVAGVICQECCRKHSLKEVRDKDTEDTVPHMPDIKPETNGHTKGTFQFNTSKIVDRIHEGDGKKRCKTCKRRLPRNFVANHCSEACARGIHPRDRK